MPSWYLSIELKTFGSGTGPQTFEPDRAASCGHTARVNHQGQPLPQANCVPAPAA